MRKSLPGKFLWFELSTSDISRAKEFYAQVVGWTYRGFPVGSTSVDMIFYGEELATMVGSFSSSSGPARWLSCVSVDDLDATVARGAANSGTIVDPIGEVPGIGRRATIRDPQGATVCLFERIRDDKPDVAWARPGEFFWNELRTTDPRAAVDFYRKMIGYTDATMGADYHVLSSAGAGRAGVQRLEHGGAPYWLPYVMTQDVDATMARVDSAGGTVVTPPTDIPGIGRFGVLRDPGGAALAVMKPIPPTRPH